MSTAPDLEMIREEIGDLLARVSAHAGAAACHAQAGTDGLMAAELRCCAATLLSASALVAELAPSRQRQREHAA